MVAKVGGKSSVSGLSYLRCSRTAPAFLGPSSLADSLAFTLVFPMKGTTISLWRQGGSHDYGINAQ